MKAIPLALLLAGPLACFLSAGAQTPTPPSRLPDPDQFFRFPETPRYGKPQFKLQIPRGGQFSLPHDFTLVNPPPPATKLGPDPGMILKPRGFEQQPSRPAAPSKIYPDLKIMPIEIATLDLAPAWPKAKGEPIPLVWPRARIEPIPANWKEFRLLPVDTGKSAKTP